LGLVVDTGVLVAAIEPRDEQHEPCARLLEGARETRVVPAPVLVELEYLLRGASDVDALSLFLDDCARGAFRIEALFPEDYTRVQELLQNYRDLRLGFVDAAVLAVTERWRERKLATLDHRRFGVLRPRHVNALELLPG
jgi:predicted nucleic acid-binding protein